MEITITVRHTDISDSLKERAVELLEKVASIAHRPHSAAVIFDSDHNKAVVEIKLSMPRGKVVVATAEADKFRTALDLVVDKVRNQVERGTSSPVRR